jgi:hypothetical protein
VLLETLEKDLPMTDDKPRRRGRPTRAEASKKALEALQAAGIDVTDIDPRVILRAIACDPSAPASARVSACRKLIDDQIDREIREANNKATDIW